MFISGSELAKLESKINAKDTQIANLRKKSRSEEAAGVAIKVAEVAGGAAMMGFVRGAVEKSGRPFAVGPVDLELAVGVGLVGLSTFKTFGRYDRDIMNVGCGILAHYAGQMGRVIGKGGTINSSVIGMLPEYVGMEPTFVGSSRGGLGNELSQALAASAA